MFSFVAKKYENIISTLEVKWNKSVGLHQYFSLCTLEKIHQNILRIRTPETWNSTRTTTLRGSGEKNVSQKTQRRLAYNYLNFLKWVPLHISKHNNQQHRLQRVQFSWGYLKTNYNIENKLTVLRKLTLFLTQAVKAGKYFVTLPRSLHEYFTDLQNAQPSGHARWIPRVFRRSAVSLSQHISETSLLPSSPAQVQRPALNACARRESHRRESSQVHLHSYFHSTYRL